MRKTNERYTIAVRDPLLRPGLEISTEVSKKYVAGTVEDLFEIVREINAKQSELAKEKEVK